MDWNVNLFFKINRLAGRSPWLDAVGRAGAEWVIFAMVGWFLVANIIAYFPDKFALVWPIVFLGTSWALGWLTNVLLGLFIKEPRPHLKYPASKLLFIPLMSWKSFPSDHAMSAWLIYFVALLFQLPGTAALLIMAGWVSLGRVFAGVHYPFDVVGGGVVAAFMATLAWYVGVLLR